MLLAGSTIKHMIPLQI